MELLTYLNDVERSLKQTVPRYICEDPMVEYNLITLNGFIDNIDADGVAMLITTKAFNDHHDYINNHSVIRRVEQKIGKSKYLYSV